MVAAEEASLGWGVMLGAELRTPGRGTGWGGHSQCSTRKMKYQTVLPGLMLLEACGKPGSWLLLSNVGAQRGNTGENKEFLC